MNQQDSARDIESVRDLDSWRPSGRSTGRLKIQKKIVAPPPTERLWLNIPQDSSVTRLQRSDKRRHKSSSEGNEPKNRREEVYEMKKRNRKSNREQKILRQSESAPFLLPGIPTSSPVRLSQAEKATPKTRSFRKGKNLLGLQNQIVDKLYQKKSSLRQVFRQFDADGSGSLSREEFRQAIGRLGFDPNSRDVDALVSYVDADSNDSIDLAEFAAGFQGEDGMLDTHNEIGTVEHHLKGNPDKNKSIILPLTLQKKQMDDQTWEKLKVQTKVLEQLYARTSDNNGRARKILNAFRGCIPNEFGVVNKQQFYDRFGRHYGLNREESNKMFDVGDKTNSGELDYSRFRTVFDPVDLNQKALQLPTFRKDKAMGEFRDAGGKLSLVVGGTSQDNSEHDRILGMPKDERDKYLLRMQIRKVLDARKHDIEPMFRALQSEDKNEQFKSTKLSYKEVLGCIKKLGLGTDGLNTSRLKEMYAGYADDEGMTFSEFYNGSNKYFSMLGQTEDELKAQKEYLMLHDINGKRLGRRKVAQYASAGKGYLSQPGFLAHDDGRLGLANATEDSLSPLKRRQAERRQEQKRREYETKHGTIKPHEPLPAGASTKWDTGQMITGTLSTGAKRDSKPVVEGTEALYDKVFDDPLAHQWKSRWLEKNVDNRKRKQYKQAQTGYYNKMNEGSTMFSLLQSSETSQAAGGVLTTSRETERTDTTRLTGRETGRETLRERYERNVRKNRKDKLPGSWKLYNGHREARHYLQKAMSTAQLNEMRRCIETPFALDE